MAAGALTSLTGGGGLSAGGGGPSSAKSSTTTSFQSDFNVTFGGGKVALLAPYALVGVALVAWLILRSRKK